MHEPVFVAFASQKGGSGKSTLTVLTASYLYYVEGVDVLVVDCDARQHTQKDYRDHDVVASNENPNLKKMTLKFYEKFKRSPYEIIYTTPEDAIEVTKEYLEEGHKPKVVFFDITGTINDIAIVNLLASMHYLFVPITPDTGDLKSSLRFATNVKESMLDPGGTSVKEMRLVWNRIPLRQKARICEYIEIYLAELHLSSLSAGLANSAKFFKDSSGAQRPTIFRSTMLPPDKQLLKDSNLPELVKEIRGIINV